MERLKLIQEIYAKLSSLQDACEVARLSGFATGDLMAQMDKLRVQLKEVMNSPCPIIKGDINE